MDDLIPAPSDKFEAESTRLNKARFIEAVGEALAIGPTAKALGISRSSIYRWMDEDPAFKAAVAEAREGAVDTLEDSAYARALKGDTVLTIFLLKNNRERYREVQAAQHAIGVVKIEFDDKPPIEHVLADSAPLMAIGTSSPIIDGAYTIEDDHAATDD